MTDSCTGAAGPSEGAGVAVSCRRLQKLRDKRCTQAELLAPRVSLQCDGEVLRLPQKLCHIGRKRADV